MLSGALRDNDNTSPGAWGRSIRRRRVLRGAPTTPWGNGATSARHPQRGPPGWTRRWPFGKVWLMKWRLSDHRRGAPVTTPEMEQLVLRIARANRRMDHGKIAYRPVLDGLINDSCRLAAWRSAVSATPSGPALARL